MASTDPWAVRSYARAGFRLEPAYSASGTVDRLALPAISEVREGGPEDLELIAAVHRQRRGAPHGDDMRFCPDNGFRVLVAERSLDRGYIVTQEGSLALLGATSPGLAQDLLWSALICPPALFSDIGVGEDLAELPRGTLRR